MLGMTTFEGRPPTSRTPSSTPNSRSDHILIGSTAAPSRIRSKAAPSNSTAPVIVDVSASDEPIEKFHIPVPRAGDKRGWHACVSARSFPAGTRGDVAPDAQSVGTLRRAPRVLVTDDPSSRTARSDEHHKSSRATVPTCPAASPPRLGASSIDGDRRLVHPASPYSAHARRSSTRPTGVRPVPPSLHGDIRSRARPNPTGQLARHESDLERRHGNRVYAACGCRRRRRHYHARPQSAYGTFMRQPEQSDQRAAELGPVSILYMSPDQGGRTSMPG